MTEKFVGAVVVLGLIGGALHAAETERQSNLVREAHAAEMAVEQVSEPRTIQIRVVTDWTEERIVEEIREMFPETPNTAVAIARCESGLKMIQSNHVLSYGREESFGIMQIHARDWDTVAKRLGYDNYQTDIRDNLKMARYLYDQRGQSWGDWTCYTKGLYWDYL